MAGGDVSDLADRIILAALIGLGLGFSVVAVAKAVFT